MTTPCKLCQQGIPTIQLGQNTYHVRGQKSAVAHYNLCTDAKPALPGTNKQ
jgi:hypothetical protein